MFFFAISGAQGRKKHFRTEPGGLDTLPNIQGGWTRPPLPLYPPEGDGQNPPRHRTCQTSLVPGPPPLGVPAPDPPKKKSNLHNHDRKNEPLRLFLWLCECLMMWPTWTRDQQLTRRNTEKSLCVLCPLQRGLPEVSGLLYLLLHLRFLHNTLYCKIKNFLYLSILQNQKNSPQCCWQKKAAGNKKNFNCRGSKRGGPITRSPEHHLDLAITTKEMWRMRAGGKRISWLFLISWGANPGDSWPNTANLGFLLELEGGVQPSVQKPGSHPKK